MVKPTTALLGELQNLLLCGRTRLLCSRDLFAWYRKFLGIGGSGSNVSTPTLFYIGSLAILTVMLVSRRCHAEWCLSSNVLAGHGMFTSKWSAISNATGELFFWKGTREAAEQVIFSNVRSLSRPNHLKEIKNDTERTHSQPLK